MATKSEKQVAIDDYVRAQQAMGKAIKNSTNPHFRSSYADLGNVYDACLKPFNDNGFTVTQPSGRDEYGDYVSTNITHVTGMAFQSKVYLVIEANYARTRVSYYLRSTLWFIANGWHCTRR